MEEVKMNVFCDAFDASLFFESPQVKVVQTKVEDATHFKIPSSRV